MLSKQAQKALIGWEPVSPRLITAKFRTSHQRITLKIIVAYAPTNYAAEESKEDFYRKLQNILGKATEKEMVILMGDMNAKVGKENTGYALIMGQHGVGCRNENGQIFLDFCADHNLVVGGTIFPHKEVHKTTWVSPDQKTCYQLNHICIRKQFRRSLLDVRTKRGAEVGSDHHLIIAKVQLNLKKVIPGNRTTKYDVKKLDEQPNQQHFQLTLRNKFQALEENSSEEEGVIERWGKIKNLWRTTCEESLGKRRKENKGWITQRTPDCMEERKRAKDHLNNAKTRAAKQKYIKEYNQIHKEIKKNVRTDKRGYYEDLATQAEEAAGQRNMRELFNIIRKLSGRSMRSEKPIKDKEGNILSTKEEQTKRWVEHFTELLNRAPASLPADIQKAETTLPLKVEKPIDALYKLSLNSNFNQDTMIRISMFYARVCRPTYLTAAKMFNIDASTIIMICGTLLSYGVIVFQTAEKSENHECQSTTTLGPGAYMNTTDGL
ncbi:hypothetical protein Ahia01_000286200 [Argonauta hians]